MQNLRSLLPILVFTALYAALSLSVTNSYYQLVMTLVPVWAIFGLSWNLLSGYTGLISFGHAAFFGVGAYAVVLGQVHFDLSPWITIPIAAVLGGIAGLLIGFPTFRLQGHSTAWRLAQTLHSMDDVPVRVDAFRNAREVLAEPSEEVTGDWTCDAEGKAGTRDRRDGRARTGRGGKPCRRGCRYRPS